MKLGIAAKQFAQAQRRCAEAQPANQFYRLNVDLFRLGCFSEEVKEDQTILEEALDHRSLSAFETYFASRLGKVTPEEFELAQSIFEATHKTVSDLSLSPRYPKFSLVDGLLLNRLVDHICDNIPNSRIVEVGRTSGMFSAIQRIKGNGAQIVDFSVHNAVFRKCFFKHLNRPALEEIDAWGGSLPETFSRLRQGPVDCCIINSSILTFSDEALSEIFGVLSNLSAGPTPTALLCYLTHEGSFIEWTRLWSVAGTRNLNVVYLADHYAILLPQSAVMSSAEIIAKLDQLPTFENEDCVIGPEQFELLTTILQEV